MRFDHDIICASSSVLQVKTPRVRGNASVSVFNYVTTVYFYGKPDWYKQLRTNCGLTFPVTNRKLTSGHKIRISKVVLISFIDLKAFLSGLMLCQEYLKIRWDSGPKEVIMYPTCPERIQISHTTNSTSSTSKSVTAYDWVDQLVEWFSNFKSYSNTESYIISHTDAADF